MSAQVQASSIPRALDTSVDLMRSVGPDSQQIRTVALPWRANLIGVSFQSSDDEGRDVTVELRARADATWSGWTALDVETDDAPDDAEARAASARISTDPQWVGTVDAVQVRVAVGPDAKAATDVRLHAINTLGDARPVNLLVRAARSVGGFLTMRPRAAEAMTLTPRILRRAQWGANESWRGSGPGVASEVKAVFLHHTDNKNNYTKSQSAALIRGIYRYHVFTKEFSDIAYNFLIDRFGQIFEGRAGGIDRAVIGAHTMGFNRYTTGVAVIGEYGSVRPSSAVLYSLRNLLAWKMDVHHIPPVERITLTSAGNERYARGKVVSFNRISGHRNAKPTACPGTYLYQRLTWLRTAVNGIGHPKIYLPRFTTATLRPDGDGVNESTVFGARFSRSVAWVLTLTDSAGAVRKTFAGSGTSVSLRWDGVDGAGVLLPSGRYAWKFDAKQGSLVARASAGNLYVVTQHPDGTVLSDTDGRYVLNGAQAQPANDPVAYRSVYGDLPAVVTGPGERSRYVALPVPVALRDGTLLQNAADQTRHIWSGGTLRAFVNDPSASPRVDTFAALGYSPDAIIAAPAAYLAVLPRGAPVDDTSVHPRGSVVRDEATGALSLIGSGVRQTISELAMRSRYRPSEVVPATPGDLAMPFDPNAVTIRPGTLVRAPDGGAPWVIADGKKRRFLSLTLFLRMGYSTAMLIGATPADVDPIPTGTPLG